MGEDNSVIARTPDKYYILDSFYQKKTGNSEYLELTLDAFRLESAIQNQELAIIESLKNNTNVSVFDHQILAAKKMINEFGCTGLLADEVGLGKTITSGLVVKECITRGFAKKILILTPPSLVNQWQHELKDKFELDDNVVLINSESKFFYYEKKLVPTLRFILKNSLLKTITVDMGAVPYAAKGVDMMRPGITEFDEEIEKNEFIVIVDETHKKPIAIGLTLFGFRRFPAASYLHNRIVVLLQIGRLPGCPAFVDHI